MNLNLRDFDTIAFSGSRKGAPPGLIQQISSRLNPDRMPKILVGCAKGVDEEIRNLCIGDTEIYKASDYDGFGRRAAALARRSAAMVEALAVSPKPILVAIPMKNCPDEVIPCELWRPAGGSGTWGTIALAIGLKVPVLLYLNNSDPPNWGCWTALSKQWFYGKKVNIATKR